jgi:diguanylate cyclase (GGDEF)-like protein/PAS domain S-box-containing protein
VIARKRVIGPVILLAITAATPGLHWSGYLARLDNAVGEMRARLLAHETDSDIVIVGIDAESLRALSEWPWPRRHHARLLQHLDRADPQEVFFDIDFSSRSETADDALFERALEEWEGGPVLLATHIQRLNRDDSETITARPLPQFLHHTELASVMLEQSPDGLVRAVQSSWAVAGELLRSIFDHQAELPASTAVRIDFSILPSSFDYVPYSQLLNGEIDPAALTGKSVYIGATAVELSDTVPVPVYRWLPGIVLQALATETVRLGLLVSPPPWIYAAVLVLWTTLCWAAFSRFGWRRNLLLLSAGAAGLGIATIALYDFFRIEFEIIAFVCSAMLVFIASALRSLDSKTWDAFALAIGVKRRDALLRSIVESTTDAIVCVDERGAIRTANPATSDLFGCSMAYLCANRINAFLPDLGDGGAVDAQAGRLFERLVETVDGRSVPVEVSISRIELDDERLYTVILRDISERKAQQERLEYQAKHDALTGLPNRTALGTHLDSTLETATTRRPVALLLLDVSRFKEVNDTLGHDVGDEVLCEVASRFTSAIGRRGAVGRIGGDEFTVLLHEISDRAEIDHLAHRLVDSLTAPIHVRGIAIEVGVSIGVALAPDHARTANELLRNADIAMNAAKDRGSALEYYERNRDLHTVRRLSMVSELRTAIENDQIDLFYQPQVALQSRQSISAEALLRWTHPMLGIVRPDEFITLAESTSLIRPLTEWTIRKAIRQALDWKRHGLEMRMGINLSARLLQDTTFPSSLASILDSSPIDPGNIELEITESAMMMDPAGAMRIVEQLHAVGVLISIDDYGTGFSSLGYLRDLPAHALKLDKSFVLDLESQERNRVIVESTVHMAHALGLEIVAEGVESDWVTQYLTRIGYDLAQGYRFAKPMPAQECFEWITHFNADRQRRAV